MALVASMASVGMGDAELAACWEAYDADPRLRFLYNLPSAAVFGDELGRAFEAAAFGSQSAASGELAAMLNLFVTVGDGLVDETPELVQGERDVLVGLASGVLDEGRIGSLEQKHPVVALAYRLVVAWRRRLDACGGPSRGGAPREVFLRACAHALAAEFTSADLELHGAFPVGALRASLREKSTRPMWTIALAPLCLRGWPRGQSREHLREAALHLGEYFGWVDDICDLKDDLAAGRWSDALLHLADGCPSIQGVQEAEGRRAALIEALTDDRAQEDLAATGQRLWHRFLERARLLPGDAGPLLELAVDATEAWLEFPEQ